MHKFWFPKHIFWSLQSLKITLSTSDMGNAAQDHLSFLNILFPVQFCDPFFSFWLLEAFSKYCQIGNYHKDK